MKRRLDIKKYLAVGLGVGSLVLGSSMANAAAVDLCAGQTTLTMPDGAVVPMWGFALGGVDAATGQCAGAIQIPGPTLDIGTDTALSINLSNTLTVPVSIIIPGQKLPTQAGGAPSAPVYNNPNAVGRDKRVRSLVHEAAPGASASYEWLDLKPGSHIYHSATHQQVQVQMGLYGAMVKNAAAGEAYPGVLYDSSVSVFYSEVDPVQHAAIGAGCFGSVTVQDPTCDGITKPAWISSTRNYNPRYYLVNGMPADGSAPIAAGEAGQNILIRLFNAGLKSHMPESLGLYMNLLAENGYPLPFAKTQYTVAVHALMTADVMVSTLNAGNYPLFDRRLRLSDGTTNTGLMSVLNVAVAGGTGAAPVANPDSLATDEDTAGTLNVVSNDTADTSVNPSNAIDPASLVIRSAPLNGSVATDALGNVTYTPAADFNGTDQFTYTVNDTAGKQSNATTVSVTVNPVNDAPVANADAFETQVGVSLTIAAGGLLVNDTDVDGDVLTVSAIDTALTAGTAVLNADSSINYTPSPTAVAPSTDSFTYTVSNGLLTSTATVTITLTAAPIVPPTAVNDSATTAEDSAVVIAVLSNDTAGSSAINPATIAVVAPANGTAVADALGNVTYTPNANYNGVDQFSYTVTDSAGQVSNVATVNLTISAVNDAPIAVADSYGAQVGVVLTVSAASGVLANDTDVENDALTAGGLNITGTAGTVSLNPNGSFTYTPAATAVAGDIDTFSYTANDGVSSSTPAVVTITIAPAPPAPPTANADSLTTNEDTVGVVNVLTNDTAGSVAIDPASVTIVTAPSHGTVLVDALGNVTYTPTLNYFGPDQFGYTVNDSDVPARTSNEAVVSITVNPVNDAPVGVADSYEIPFWSGVVVTPAASGVLFNDTDIEGDVLTATSLDTTGTAGTVVLYPDGSFAYTPRVGAAAGEVDTFTYIANDGAANSNVTTVTINIIQGTPVTNVLPEARGDTVVYSRGANGNGPMVFNMSVLLANDSDPDDPNFPVGSTIVLVDANNDGIADTRLNGSSITFNAASGMLTYTPVPGTSTRNDRFWYHVIDARGGISNEASVVVRVNP